MLPKPPTLPGHAPLLRSTVQANNVAEMLLIRGLAQVVKHRADEERSGGRLQGAAWGQ